MWNRVEQIVDFLLSLIYPDRCVMCDNVIAYNQGICRKCLPLLKPIGGLRCTKCGKPIENEDEEYCFDCSRYTHHYTRGWPLLAYDDNVKKSIYRFKYGNRQRYSRFYGKAIAKHLGNIILRLRADAIIPVPLHKKKLRERGYNQAYLLAREMGKELSIPVIDDLVVRCRYTKPLKILGMQERQNNLKKAFKIAKNDVKLKTIILVDDIYTTGSTIDEISKLLGEYGVENIYFVTLSAGYNI